MGVLGIRGLAVVVLVVVIIEADKDRRVEEAKEALTGELGVKRAETGEVAKVVVGVGVDDDCDEVLVVVGENGMLSEDREGLDERVGERRLETEWDLVRVAATGANLSEGGFGRGLRSTGGRTRSVLACIDILEGERSSSSPAGDGADDDGNDERFSLLSLRVLLVLASLLMKEARRFLVPPFGFKPLSFFFLWFSISPATELVRDQREAVAGGGDSRFVPAGVER